MGKLIQYCTEQSKKDGDFLHGSWPAAGMGYLIQTENRHFIAIDGGQDRADAEGLIAIMEEIAGERPVVDLWMVSHPHGDHIWALREIANDASLLSRVQIKALCYSIPPLELTPWDQGSPKTMLEITEKLGVPVITPHADDELDIDGTKVKFFFTWENFEDVTKYKTFNALSMIFKITGKYKSAMFIGDSTGSGPRRVNAMYGDRLDELKADIVQLAHHGLDGGDTWFYKNVDASIALVPTSLGGGKYERMPEITCCAANMYAQERAFTVIQAFSGTASIEF